MEEIGFENDLYSSDNLMMTKRKDTTELEMQEAFTYWTANK